MYRRPKFLEVLIEIRQEMAREADYDVDFFAEIVRSGKPPARKSSHSLIDPPADGEQGEIGKNQNREPTRAAKKS